MSKLWETGKSLALGEALESKHAPPLWCGWHLAVTENSKPTHSWLWFWSWASLYHPAPAVHYSNTPLLPGERQQVLWKCIWELKPAQNRKSSCVPVMSFRPLQSLWWEHCSQEHFHSHPVLYAGTFPSPPGEERRLRHLLESTGFEYSVKPALTTAHASNNVKGQRWHSVLGVQFHLVHE